MDYSGCGEGDGGIGHGKRRSRTGGASLRGRWVGWQVSGGRAPSGWEWNGSQSGQGAAELLLPGPAPGKMQSEAARRAGEPSGQGKDPSSEGLGGHDPFTQADAGCPGCAPSPVPLKFPPSYLCSVLPFITASSPMRLTNRP